MKEIKVNAITGFKDGVKYTEKEFANIWDAMIGDRRPKFEPSINQDGTWTISTIATTRGGYGFYNDEVFEISFANEIEPIFYLWLKTDNVNEELEIIFDTTGDDLSLQDSETVKYDYLYDAVRDNDGNYLYVDSPRLSEDNPALKIFEPVIIEKVINVNDVVDIGESLTNFKKMRVYCAGADSTAPNNTILDIPLPMSWDSGVTARGASAFDTSGAGVTPTVIIAHNGNDTTFRVDKNYQIWHYYYTRTAHKVVHNLRIIRIELYRY